MKFTFFVLSTIFLFASSCQKERRMQGNDTVSEQTKASETDVAGRGSTDYRKLLKGIWAENEESNALFEIKGDSLYYFEDPVPVFYEVIEDTFKIYIEGKVFPSQIIKLSSDSLVRIEYGEVIRLYKR